MKQFFLLGIFLLCHYVYSQPSRLLVNRENTQVFISGKDNITLSSPPEGLWSIATGWENQWPNNWHHVKFDSVVVKDNWTHLYGRLSLMQGDWLLRDSYIEENGKIKCIRRFQWKGKENLNRVTLSVRWQLNVIHTKVFLPGIVYYGNPSGEKNGKDKVAWIHGEPGEIALFEEHRYTMPFTSVEWGDSQFNGAAMHTVPSPVVGGNRYDQWWSLGVQVKDHATELVALSGPIATNRQKSVAKALQNKLMPYEDTYINVEPEIVIEKTFYLEVYPVQKKGSGFLTPVNTSINLNQPFSLEGFPTVKQIIKDKFRFAKSRWVESEQYAGFNMYPSFVKPQIVLGWAGQSEAPAYALQLLADDIGDPEIWHMVQHSLDHIIKSPVSADGFPVIYDIQSNTWSNPDPVSVGQAMNNIALAIRAGKINKKVHTKEGELFLRKAADALSAKILKDNWSPRNTAEAFYISPLLLSYELLKIESYKTAALKAADYYAHRHISMDEPYWGGTLDATCEDKEGSWGAFQGFLAAYELTKEQKYLDYAKHAGYATLSYTVVWDIPMPAGRVADYNFKTRGWTGVSAQNQHLDVYGVLIAPSIYKLGTYIKDENLQKIAKVMYRSCGQLIDPFGSQGEQITHTNFAQHGDMSNVYKLRGGYSESWTVFWITAHFLHAAAQFKELGVTF